MNYEVNELGFQCSDDFWDPAFPIDVEDEPDFFVEELSDEDFLKCLGFE